MIILGENVSGLKFYQGLDDVGYQPVVWYEILNGRMEDRCF